VREVLKYDRDVIYRTVMEYPSLMRKVTSHINHFALNVRTAALKVICAMAFANSLDIAFGLLEMGVLNLMMAAYSIPASSDSQYYCQHFLNILSNIATNSSRMAITVFEHPVFAVVLDLLHSPHTVSHFFT
jgi:hypothetical protein